MLLRRCTIASSHTSEFVYASVVTHMFLHWYSLTEFPAWIDDTSPSWPLEVRMHQVVLLNYRWKKAVLWGSFHQVNPKISIHYVLDYQRGVTLAKNSSERFPCPDCVAGTLSWVPFVSESAMGQTAAFRGKGGVELGIISTADGSSLYVVWPVHLLFPYSTQKNTFSILSISIFIYIYLYQYHLYHLYLHCYNLHTIILFVHSIIHYIIWLYY